MHVTSRSCEASHGPLHRGCRCPFPASGAFTGQWVGHIASGGDKNAGLQAALYGLIIGAAAAVALLAWWGRRHQDWRPAGGGIAAGILEAVVVGWLILPR
jgi:hypothetical protein